MEKPVGGELEYDLLNTLVAADAPAILERSLSIHDATGWGLCRCRMAAIIEATSRRFGWRVKGVEAQRRALIMARLAPRSHLGVAGWPGRKG